MHPVKVAAVDFVPAWGDLEGNISRLAAAVERVAQQGVGYAVFPETAVSGYLFSGPEEIAPFLDTVPGRTTAALAPVLARTGMHVSVGIAERDLETGLAYNTAVLLGPAGIIGKYRKNGLNPQDQKVFAPGDTGVEVFDTPVGRIALLICYDDTYWQYARLAALRGAQVIGWHSVSDRTMPGATAAEKKGDHSTVAHVQYMSAQNGVFVVAATRSGVETNPHTGGQLYYNGGSSIWSPDGHKLVQAPVAPPKLLPPGLHAVYTADLDLAQADATRTSRLALRRPELYHPLLAFHRSPVDSAATAAPRAVSLVAAQWPAGVSQMAGVQIVRGGLTVLPALTALSSELDAAAILASAEPRDGPFERALASVARDGGGHVVGSYPERDGSKVFHTVVLAGPEGSVLARYRVTHPAATPAAAWAEPGDGIVVATTSLGRIGLASADELAVPEVAAMYACLRTDILAAPASLPQTLKVEIDPALYAMQPPTGRADFYPYAAAKQGQLWLVCGGRRWEGHTAAAIYGPEPVVATPTLTAAAAEASVRHEAMAPAPGTWINQAQLIAGQQAQWFPPLVLTADNPRFLRWRSAPAGSARLF